MVRMLSRVGARVMAGVCAAVAIVSLSACSLMTPALDEAPSHEVAQTVDDALLVQPGTLTVAVDTADAPQAMVGADGSIEGYAVDVAADVAARLGLKLEIVSAVSPADVLSSGEADVFVGALATDESAEVTVFGDYLETAIAIFGKPAEGATVTASDIAAATVAVQDGSASQEALARANIVSSQQTFSNVNECFEALGAGEVQYVACDAASGAYLARAYPGTSFVGAIGATSAYGFAMNAQSTELTQAVSQALDAITTDGSLDAVHASWYGSLPLSLSGSAVSGVTIPDATEATSEDGANETDSLNSLS